jgi:hypothetical protein
MLSQPWRAVSVLTIFELKGEISRIRYMRQDPDPNYEQVCRARAAMPSGA